MSSGKSLPPTPPAVDMKSATDQFSVKTVCQMTGLNEHTLRAWERRYQVVQPKRLDNGRRIYGIEDLEKLKLVTLLVRKGFLIGNIATSSIAELNVLVNNSASVTPIEVGRRTRNREYLEHLKRTVGGYELQKVHSLLQQARIEYGIRDFLLEIVIPFISHIGLAVERGEFSIGQEHAWSAIVRSELMQILYLLSGSHSLMRLHESPKIFAIATNEGNQHEFGALICAVLCAFYGFPTFYFGPNMPAASLAEAARAVAANGIIVGLPVVSDTEPAGLNCYLDELRKKMPKVCELWVGGFATEEMLADKDIHVMESLLELDSVLATIRNV